MGVPCTCDRILYVVIASIMIVLVIDMLLFSRYRSRFLDLLLWTFELHYGIEGILT
jgi:hypothetical protein